VNFGPLAAEICSLVWCNLANLNRFLRLGSVTARHSSSRHQPNCGVEQRAPPIFGRVAITLHSGPHSSYKLHLSCNLMSFCKVSNVLWICKQYGLWQPVGSLQDPRVCVCVCVQRKAGQTWSCVSSSCSPRVWVSRWVASSRGCWRVSRHLAPLAHTLTVLRRPPRPVLHRHPRFDVHIAACLLSLTL